MTSYISVQFSALWHMLYPLLGLTESSSAQTSPRTCGKPACRLLEPNPLCNSSLTLYPMSAHQFTPLDTELNPQPSDTSEFRLDAASLPKGRKNPSVTWGSTHVFPFSQDHSPILPVDQWLKTTASRFCGVLLLFMVEGHVHISHCHGRKLIGTFSSAHNKSWKLTIC